MVEVTVSDLVTLLKEHFAATNLGGFRYAVLAWYPPRNMYIDHLENNAVDVLVSVKPGDTVMEREYNRVPLTERCPFEIAVWQLDTPHYRTKCKIPPYELMVREIKRCFKLKNNKGTVKGVVNADTAVKQAHVLCKIVLVTHLNEELAKI